MTDDPKTEVGSFAPTQVRRREKWGTDQAVPPLGLVERTAALHFARFGVWLPWYMTICKHVVPSRVRALAAQFAAAKPWVLPELVRLGPSEKPTTLVFPSGRRIHFDASEIE